MDQRQEKYNDISTVDVTSGLRRSLQWPKINFSHIYLDANKSEMVNVGWKSSKLQ